MGLKIKKKKKNLGLSIDFPNYLCDLEKVINRAGVQITISNEKSPDSYFMVL